VLPNRVEAAARALPANRGGGPICQRPHPRCHRPRMSKRSKSSAQAREWPTPLDAGWTVVYVETPELAASVRSRARPPNRPSAARGVIRRGKPSHSTVPPQRPPSLSTLKRGNATRVVVGHPKRKGWRAWIRPQPLLQLMKEARGFDVIAIAAATDTSRKQSAGLGSAYCHSRSSGIAMPGEWSSPPYAPALPSGCIPVSSFRIW